jgi:hypothetical protein
VLTSWKAWCENVALRSARAHRLKNLTMSNNLLHVTPLSQCVLTASMAPAQRPPPAMQITSLATSKYQTIHTEIAKFLEKDLFFIGAHPKSGTTWLQVMLNTHPEVSCSGEGHFINRFSPLIKSALKSHNLLIASKNSSIFKEFKPFPLFSGQDFAYVVASSIALMLMRSNDHQRARVIGEKTPDNVLHFSQLAALFPRAKFLHMLRDGRDCAVSTWFHNLRVNPKVTRRRYPAMGDFVEFMAKSWKTHVEAGMHFHAACPTRCLAVRFEDAVTNPRDTMCTVFRFLGADTSHATLRHCVEAGRFETMSNGRQRGVEDPTSFLRQGMPGNWRRHLTPEDNETFLAIAGDVMTRVGYSH